MQEQSRYSVGIDLGTTEVKCVVGAIDTANGAISVVGVGRASNSGMRKGIIANLNGPASAVDKALGEAERMSGYEVNSATLSVNGTHIICTRSDGMIAISSVDSGVTRDDVQRIEDVATIGKIPANREVLDVVPLDYKLDGQSGIKDPINMTGTRLEIIANVISALVPHIENTKKAAELATVRANHTVPAVIASARAVLDDSQKENGVVVIDLGGATTGVAVYEEGDLQYVSVIPFGGVNVTNDLAIGLKVDPALAEKVKLQHAVAGGREGSEGVNVKDGSSVLTFQTEEIDEIVEARLEEIFDLVNKELKKAGKAGQLPNGAVLVGGGSNMKGMVDFAKKHLSLSAKVGKPTGFGGSIGGVDSPEFSAAIGLMFIDADLSLTRDSPVGSSHKNVKHKQSSKGRVLKNLFDKLKP